MILLYLFWCGGDKWAVLRGQGGGSQGTGEPSPCPLRTVPLSPENRPLSPENRPLCCAPFVFPSLKKYQKKETGPEEDFKCVYNRRGLGEICPLKGNMVV